MIYDKANFYFHFPLFIVFSPQFLAAFQWKKSPWKVAFALVEMENVGK